MVWWRLRPRAWWTTPYLGGAGLGKQGFVIFLLLCLRKASCCRRVRAPQASPAGIWGSAALAPPCVERPVPRPPPFAPRPRAQDSDVRNKYRPGPLLGKGSYGLVLGCVNKENKLRCKEGREGGGGG